MLVVVMEVTDFHRMFVVNSEKAFNRDSFYFMSMGFSGSYRWETSTTHSGLHRVRSQDSVTNHQGGEKTQRSAAMDLLRGYYGLPASRTEGEGTELATFSFDNEYAEDEPFSPMFRPSDTANPRRLSTDDYRTSRFDQARETRNSSEPSLAATGLLMKPSREPLGIGEKFGEIEVVTETDPHIKERPVRRRGRGDLSDDIFDVSERVNFPEKVSAPRAKDSNSGFNRQGTPVATNGWHNAGEGPLGSSGVKTVGAALFGGKGAVEGLISKVLQSTVPESGKSSTGALPTSTGTPSVLEGITQVYRRAKAALD